MTDIVERLRRSRWKDQSGAYTNTYDLSGVEAERLDAADEIEWLRAEKETRHQMIKTLIDADPRHDLAAEIERLRAFAESVRNWKRLPLWELTDTDHERAAAFRRQLEIHAEAARKALEEK